VGRAGDANGEFAGTFPGLLTPYPLLVGVTTVALFMMHGAIYGCLHGKGSHHRKTDGANNHGVKETLSCR